MGVETKSPDVILSTSFKEASLNIFSEFSAGHTYIPNAQVIDDVAAALVDDVGTGFNQECMPLRRFAIFYGGSSDGKKPCC